MGWPRKCAAQLSVGFCLPVHICLTTHTHTRIYAHCVAVWAGFILLFSYHMHTYTHMQIIADPASSPRQKVAARLTKIEKSILAAAAEALAARGAPREPAALEAAQAAAAIAGLKMASLFDGGHCG